MANALNQDLTTLAGPDTKAVSDEDMEIFLINMKKQEKEQLSSFDRISKAKKLYDEQIFAKRVEQIKKTEKDEAIINKKIADLQANRIQSIAELAKKMEENIYKYSTASQKSLIKQQQQESLNLHKQKLAQQITEIAASQKSDAEKIKATHNLQNEILKSSRAEITLEREKQKLNESILKQKIKNGTASRKMIDAEMDAINESLEKQAEGHAKNLDNINERIELLKKLKEEKGDKDGSLGKQITELEGEAKEEKKELNRAKATQLGEGLQANAMKGLTKALNEGLSALGNKIGGAINSAIETVGQYRSGIEARLQGSGSGYDNVAKTLKQSLAVSPFVKQKDVIQKLKEAVDAGIAYNVEQRAFLATMTDKVVSTFNAFDSNLMRIIRLQQADTTAARMGMEAELLQFFNSTYHDSSYLTEGYDQVAGALVDATSQMSRDMSIAFEYNVQKWLGSLASLGFGTDTLQTIATGINYLGSGNVQALSGNDQLQTLLAMSASRAGLSYSEMLIKGIDDSNVNTLLKSMVEYLKEIAEDENKVVKAAYGDILNFTQSDLKAISNITAADIEDIYGRSMDYGTAVGEVQSQLNQMSKRLSTTELIDNVFENFLYTSGETIANNVISAVTWKLVNTVEDFTGGIHLPAVSVLGNMVDLSTFTIEGIIKTGMFGISALANLPNIVSSIKSGGGLDLGIWGASEFNTRGGGVDSSLPGVQEGISGSSSKANASASEEDIKKGAISDTDKDQDLMKKQSEEKTSGSKTIDDLYEATTAVGEAIAASNSQANSANTSTAASNQAQSQRLEDIYAVLSSGALSVKVSNLESAIENLKPQKVQRVKVVDDTSETGTYINLPEFLNKILKALEPSVEEKDPQTKQDEEKYTIDRLIKYIIEQEGPIRVEDPQTINELKNMELNLI